MRVKTKLHPFLHVLKIMSLKKNQKNARETISRNRFFLELVVAVLMPVIVLRGYLWRHFYSDRSRCNYLFIWSDHGVVVYKKLSLVQLMGVFFLRESRMFRHWL